MSAQTARDESYMRQALALAERARAAGEVPVGAVISEYVDVAHAFYEKRESGFVNGLLDSPHYTRPEVYEGEPVPPVLMGGNHAEIMKWRRQRMLEATFRKRPDQLERARASGQLSKADEKFLAELDKPAE